jgi:hypothetical protein
MGVIDPVGAEASNALEDGRSGKPLLQKKVDQGFIERPMVMFLVFTHHNPHQDLFTGKL